MRPDTGAHDRDRRNERRGWRSHLAKRTVLGIVGGLKILKEKKKRSQSDGEEMRTARNVGDLDHMRERMKVTRGKKIADRKTTNIWRVGEDGTEVDPHQERRGRRRKRPDERVGRNPGLTERRGTRTAAAAAARL